MSLARNLNHIKTIIANTEMACNRPPGSVLLLAVSKQQPVEAMMEVFQLGVDNFAESYFQEAQQKINKLKNLAICWHFIGPVQSNKAKGVASCFNWVHSIERYKIAALLNEHRPENLEPLNVCLQINLLNEKTKSGIPAEDASTLALQVQKLPNLRLRGLMAIPPPQKNEEEQLSVLLQLNQLLQTINKESGLTMDTLSMGMSDDIVPAIKAGSTIVRIGRAIFGERENQ